jgi:hypothetical protein
MLLDVAGSGAQPQQLKAMLSPEATVCHVLTQFHKAQNVDQPAFMHPRCNTPPVRWQEARFHLMLPVPRHLSPSLAHTPLPSLHLQSSPAAASPQATPQARPSGSLVQGGRQSLRSSSLQARHTAPCCLPNAREYIVLLHRLQLARTCCCCCHEHTKHSALTGLPRLSKVEPHSEAHSGALLRASACLPDMPGCLGACSWPGAHCVPAVCRQAHHRRDAGGPGGPGGEGQQDSGVCEGHAFAACVRLLLQADEHVEGFEAGLRGGCCCCCCCWVQ